MLLDYFDLDSSEYEIDYGMDSSEEKLLSGPAQGLVVTSTLGESGRYINVMDAVTEHLGIGSNHEFTETFHMLAANLDAHEGLAEQLNLNSDSSEYIGNDKVPISRAAYHGSLSNPRILPSRCNSLCLVVTF
jgi:hypothetical protein